MYYSDTMRRYVLFLTVIFGISLLVLSGCTNTATTSEEPYSSWTISSDKSNLQFTASLVEDCDKWYRYLLNVNTSLVYTSAATYTGTVRIDAGYKNDAMGLTFLMDSNYQNYYSVVIDSTGQYSIRQMKAGVWIIIKDWTPSVNLKKGFGIENLISVSQISGKDLQVSFNGVIETTFWNSDLTNATGFPGFIVYVSKAVNQNFPTVPVLVKYTLSAPVKYPN